MRAAVVKQSLFQRRYHRFLPTDIVIDILHDIMVTHGMQRLKILCDISIDTIFAQRAFAAFAPERPFEIAVSFPDSRSKSLDSFAHFLMPPPDNHRSLSKVRLDT